MDGATGTIVCALLPEWWQRLDTEALTLRIEATEALGAQQTWLVELEDWHDVSLAELRELFNQPVQDGESLYERVRSSLPTDYQHARIEIERRGLRLNWAPEPGPCRRRLYWFGWLLAGLLMLVCVVMASALLNTMRRQ